MKMPKRTWCIPFLRPHKWHQDGYNELDDVLVLRCEYCDKYKYKYK